MTKPPDRIAVAPVARRKQRLPAKILIAFHHACDQGDIEVARSLLGVLESVVRRLPTIPNGRENRAWEGDLVAAYERLWQMQHPGSLDS
jgi:hypothetical protein